MKASRPTAPSTPGEAAYRVYLRLVRPDTTSPEAAAAWSIQGHAVKGLWEEIAAAAHAWHLTPQAHAASANDYEAL